MYKRQQLRQLSGGVDEIVAENVLFESINFSELTPSVIYIVHQEEESQLYYRLRFDTQLVDLSLIHIYIPCTL